MSELKPYFLSRVGRRLSWPADGAGDGAAWRRYDIGVRGVDRDTLLATVGWQDFGRGGHKTSSSPIAESKVVRVTLRGLDSASEALEDAARAADPKAFLGKPPPRRGTGAADSEAIEQRLTALMAPEARSEGEAAPAGGSVARFRAFWTATPGLVAPDIFSSKDGTLRARWNHGAAHTLWVNFPAKGPLGWSVSFPREGASGLRKINARCIDEQDIIPCAAMLGVRCSR